MNITLGAAQAGGSMDEIMPSFLESMQKVKGFTWWKKGWLCVGTPASF